MAEQGLRQMLPIKAYSSSDWFEREQREIFSRGWSFAGLESDVREPGEFLTAQCGRHNIFVLRSKDKGLRAFHNICRHRGTELLEGCGELGKAIVCPYHKWSYSLEGKLLGAPQEDLCFPGLNKEELGLHPASVASLKGMIFVHPDPEPGESFGDWAATLLDVIWPHEFEEMSEGPQVVYEMKCNWKVFYENAIDGYHLAYLHNKTLGGPLPSKNLWEPHGRHMVWYSTEDGGRKTSLPADVANTMAGSSKIKGAESSAYGGVYMLYPDSIVTASPYDFAISSILPIGPAITRLKVRTWGRRTGGLLGGIGVPRREGDSEIGIVRLEDLEEHPMESGDFMLEDLWICEKIQRSIQSPLFAVGALAQGPGCETPLTWFQAQVLRDLSEIA